MTDQGRAEWPPSTPEEHNQYVRDRLSEKSRCASCGKRTDDLYAFIVHGDGSVDAACSDCMEDDL